MADPYWSQTQAEARVHLQATDGAHDVVEDPITGCDEEVR
jgi:hypothetical protein